MVISHHYMIQNLLAQGYRKNHQPVSSIVDEVPNAVPIETSVQQLLSVVWLLKLKFHHRLKIIIFIIKRSKDVYSIFKKYLDKSKKR